MEYKKRRSPFKWLIIAGLIVAAIYYGPGLLRGGDGKNNTAPEQAAAPVSVASVELKPITQWNEFSGVFEAVHAAQIRPQVGGHITAIHFTDGEQVKKGEALFTIDPRPFEAAVTSTKGALAQAQAALGRAQKLVKTNAISRAEFEQAQSAHEQALGNHQTAQVNLGYTRITAPLAGKISRAEITVGNVVEAGPNAPLLASVVSLSPMYASFEVDEQTYLKTIQGVAAAQLKAIPIELGLSNGTGTPLAARIHSFDNQLTPGSGTIRVRALFENADGTVLPGLYARIRLGAAQAGEVALINPAAIGTDQSKKFVFVVGEGSKAEYREVTLGAVVDGLQIINSGLKAGEVIVVNGLQRVQPGAPIQAEAVDMLTLKPLAAADAPTASEAPAATPAPDATQAAPDAASTEKP